MLVAKRPTFTWLRGCGVYATPGIAWMLTRLEVFLGAWKGELTIFGGILGAHSIFLACLGHLENSSGIALRMRVRQNAAFH